MDTQDLNAAIIMMTMTMFYSNKFAAFYLVIYLDLTRVSTHTKAVGYQGNLGPHINPSNYMQSKYEIPCI
jgi:hypothetical protein